MPMIKTDVFHFPEKGKAIISVKAFSVNNNIEAESENCSGRESIGKY